MKINLVSVFFPEVKNCSCYQNLKPLVLIYTRFKPTTIKMDGKEKTEFTTFGFLVCLISSSSDSTDYKGKRLCALTHVLFAPAFNRLRSRSLHLQSKVFGTHGCHLSVDQFQQQPVSDVFFGNQRGLRNDRKKSFQTFRNHFHLLR